MRCEREALDRLAQGVGTGGRGAAGIAEVLDALNQARVETLLIARELPGRAAAWTSRPGCCCPTDADAGEPVEDIVEPAIEKAIEQSATRWSCATTPTWRRSAASGRSSLLSRRPRNGHHGRADGAQPGAGAA